MASVQNIAVHYVVAPSASQAERLAELIWAGTIPPIAHTAAEAVALAATHPRRGSYDTQAYRVYTGLARPRSKLLEPNVNQG